MWLTFEEVSVTEIINELPKLTHQERRLVHNRLLELSAEDSEVNSCNESALQGAALLDAMEEKDLLSARPKNLLEALRGLKGLEVPERRAHMKRRG